MVKSWFHGCWAWMASKHSSMRLTGMVNCLWTGLVKKDSRSWVGRGSQIWDSEHFASCIAKLKWIVSSALQSLSSQKSKRRSSMITPNLQVTQRLQTGWKMRCAREDLVGKRACWCFVSLHVNYSLLSACGCTSISHRVPFAAWPFVCVCGWLDCIVWCLDDMTRHDTWWYTRCNMVVHVETHYHGVSGRIWLCISPALPQRCCKSGVSGVSDSVSSWLVWQKSLAQLRLVQL